MLLLLFAQKVKGGNSLAWIPASAGMTESRACILSRRNKMRMENKSYTLFNLMKTFLIIVVILLILWTLWSIYISRAEQLSYTVSEVRDGYEIRTYEPYIAATVTVDQTGQNGLNSAFRILTGYIFG